MREPRRELRDEIAQEFEVATAALSAAGEMDPAREEVLDGVLERIQREVTHCSQGLAFQSAEEDLAAVEAWAALASWAIGRVYAPTGPWPKGSAGWSAKAPKRLRKIADELREPLARDAKAIGADSFSISVGFPWGIAIALSWPVGSGASGSHRSFRGG